MKAGIFPSKGWFLGWVAADLLLADLSFLPYLAFWLARFFHDRHCSLKGKRARSRLVRRARSYGS